MAVITRTNRVLNVVSVVRDVVTDNKSMVGGTAIAGHALAVHLLSHQQLPGYQPSHGVCRENACPLLNHGEAGL